MSQNTQQQRGTLGDEELASTFLLVVQCDISDIERGDWIWDIHNEGWTNVRISTETYPARWTLEVGDGELISADLPHAMFRQLRKVEAVR